ncbi:MAG TPA: HlyD family efflux transporter periplasmic adaptor subunit [Terriglobales bacterium]
MNIVRAFEVALPELPERLIRHAPPKLDPRVIFKQHIENGDPVIVVRMPGTESIYRFVPLQWQLVELFDGQRSFKEVADLYQQQTGAATSEDDVRELASFLQAQTQLLYKTPLEQNIALQQELRSSREKRSRFKDLSDIPIKVWEDADGYISRLYPRLKFLFTPWFVWLSIGMFALMGWMWADRFGEVWSDSFAFYNFTAKSGSDLVEFWFLFGAMAFVHETAHGLAAKHYGTTIERMGFTLLYFAPSFYCDATQVWVLGGKWARIATAFAGIWLDLVVCFFATVVWWGTATGMLIHDWAYKVMMVTGLGVSILNLNPLIKLDGYLIFSELVHEPTLKESSTEYLSAWMRKYVFGLAVEVPYVPRRKRAFYVIYGILSGAYSYVLLSFLMLITYHILLAYSPEWAFLPAVTIGCWVFRSRIRLVGKFMKLVYLDKKERARAWLTPGRIAVLCVTVLILLFAPVWPDFVQAPFLVQAAHRYPVRTTVPGVIEHVSVQEGEHVAAGSLLLRMRNLELESAAAQAASDLASASARATQASLRYEGLAAAEQERQQLSDKSRILAEKLGQLNVTSPISGTVMTAHPDNLTGSSPDEGDFLMEVADTSEVSARLYLPEFALHDVHLGAPVRLLVIGGFQPFSATLSSLSPAAVPVAEGLIPKQQLQGLNPPRYYLATAMLRNDGNLRDGMTGSAKVFVQRRSLVGFTWRFISDLANRKVW